MLEFFEFVKDFKNICIFLLRGGIFYILIVLISMKIFSVRVKDICKKLVCKVMVGMNMIMVMIWKFFCIIIFFICFFMVI